MEGEPDRGCDGAGFASATAVATDEREAVHTANPPEPDGKMPEAGGNKYRDDLHCKG